MYDKAQWQDLYFFNIYVNDLFANHKNTDVYNFADGTTPNVCNESLQKGLESLEQKAELTLTCFENNYMKLNKDN